MKKQYNVVVTERLSVARSKRLREAGQSTSGTVVKIVGGGTGGSSGGDIGDGHTHGNLPTLNRIKTDADDYLVLNTPVLNEETGVVEIKDERVKAGYADETGHTKEADHAENATHADKAHDLDADSPIFEKVLSSVEDDEAAGHLTLHKGITVENGISTDTLTATETVSAKLLKGTNIEAIETISGKNITATKKVSAETIVATGAVKGNYVDATEDVSGKNVLASEGVAGKTVTATDTVKGNHVQAAETVSGKNVVASQKVTTLNLLVQELADTYDLSVSHVATLFRTIVKDYISSEQFIPGFTGNGMKLYKALNGDWNLELDNLTVRKAMTVFELIISKIRAVNGGLVISPAYGKVKSVLLTNGIYRLEIEDDMMFVDDDLVRCQSFSVKSGVKYYWVRITSVSGSYLFINATEFTNSLPAVGDDLVQFGNKTNKLRQGLLYLTAAEDGKPRISVLDGVNSTDLTDKTKVILGCLDDIVDSDFPADSQPTGYGLYAMNVFLKGMFILRNGKTVESELNTTNAAVKAAQSVADAAKSAASAAQNTASAAATAAATANSLLTDIASDNKLTATEKQQTKKEWDVIVSEKPLNNASAVKFALATTSYDTAYNALNTYLTPLLANLATTSDIVGTTFRSTFKAYYDARTNLLNAVSASAKTLADNAQTKANEAASAAGTAQTKANEAAAAAGAAQTTANNAVVGANGANALLADIANDNKFTPSEKQATKKEWDTIVSEKPLNDASADKFAVSKSTYGTAYSALSTYITPLLSSLTTTSGITGSDFRAKFKAYYDARTNLLNAISAKAKSLADDAQASVDNLRVGGRNLLPNSDFSRNSLTGWTASADGNFTLSIENGELNITGRQGRTSTELNNSWNTAWYVIPYSFNEAGDYTLSFEAYALVECTLHFRANYFTYPVYGGSVQIGITKKKYSIVFKNGNYDASRLLGFVSSVATTLFIDNIQLETGNKATDWTPAPEDIDAKITTIETNFEIREGQISAKVTEVTTKVTQAAASATNAKTSETNAAGSASTAGSRATAASGSATAAAGSATTAGTKAGEAATSAANAKKSADDAAVVLKDVTVKESSITQTAGQIATKVTEVNTKVTEANTAATNAKKSETAAGSSATSASGSATTATTKAGEAATSATNAKASADTAAAKLTTITEKESSINQTASQISTKVTEVTKKATEASTSATNAASSATSASGSASTATTKANAASSSATAAAGSATTAGTKAGEAATSATNAKASADSAAAKLTTITQKESSINQTASNITLQVTEVTNKASQASASAANASNAAELAMAMSQGKMLYRDPSFEKGSNGISVYNNSNNGTVTIARLSGIAGNPNGSGYCLKITTTGAASPGWGGWVLSPNVKANQRLVYRFIANIPVGRTLGYNRNSAGDGVVEKWLTSNNGTGKWEEYAYVLRCGATGTFSNCGHFYLTGGATPTTAAPLVWYVAYATVFDVTDAEIDYIADAAGKYTTKTEHSSSITQLSNSIELKVAKTDFNALGNRVSNAETTISQHTGQIALKASQSDVTALGTRMSSAEAKITPDAIKLTVKSQTDTIAASAASNAVNDLQMGGRNYFKKTTGITVLSGTPTISRTNAECVNGVYLVGDSGGTSGVRISNVITCNGYWTISFELRGSQSTPVGFNVDFCDLTSLPVRSAANNAWNKYTFTANVTNASSVYNFIDLHSISWAYIYVRNIKIEQGNKPTDWTPAPEDIDKDITNAQSTADTAKSAASTAQSGVNSLGTRISSAETTISQHSGQIALKAAQTSVDALGVRMSSAEAKITPDAIKLTVKSQTDSIVSDAVRRTDVWVDATGLDATRYYPVTMLLNTSVGMYTIVVERVLSGSYGKPSWSTHSEGFSVLCKWTTNANGWGVRGVQRTILDYTSSFASVVPVGSISQLTESSQEYIYVRGGSKYHIVVEGQKDVTVTLRTSTYTWTGSGYTQTLGILSSVSVPVPDITAINTRITNVETSFEIREGQISAKVTEVTTKATQAATSATNAKTSETNAGTKATAAANSATAASGSATTAGQKATAAANSASDAAAKLASITTKETSINQTASQITIQASTVTTKTAEAVNAAELAAAMSKGKMLYRDPVFSSGVNDCTLYNNSGNGLVTLARVSGIAGNPNGSGYCLKVTATGAASPGWGGFTFSTISKANKMFIVRLIANIPVGRSIEWASNATGTGGTNKWLTSQAGTGKWQEYACKVVCGASGTFSSTNFFYLFSGTTPTAAAPVTWYVAYATVFDTTDVDDVPTVDEVKAGLTVSANKITIFGKDIVLTGAVTADTIAANAITSIKIAANSITANHIQANAITAVKIAAGVIDATKIDVDSIQAAVVTATKIAALNITTKNLTVTNGAHIGNFAVENGGLYAENTVAIFGMSNSSYSTHMSAGQIVIDHPSAGNALVVNGGLCDVIFDVKSFTAKNCTLSVSDNNKPSLTLNNGFISGMAIKVRQTSGSVSLDHSDCWVTCSNASTITVYLPSNPQLGKIIYIMRVNVGRVDVNGNGKNINYGNTIGSVAPINNRGEIDTYVYDGTIWRNGWMNY